MGTYHIHIKGIVQGVGFRPFVCRAAEHMRIKGCVSNTNDGVHIAVNGTEEQAKNFCEHIVKHPPANALISGHTFVEIEPRDFSNFSIIHSITNAEPDLLLTPDHALCDCCRQEIHDPSSTRQGYAFTTCLNCGPRYSIQTALPYDRAHTTMHHMHMCAECEAEYHDIHSRRHFSQTNSCPDCAVLMSYHQGETVTTDQREVMLMVINDIKAGRIVAVKGIGGYLLICDATDADAVATLRTRKRRAAKPFAVMYPSLESASRDVELNAQEIVALRSKVAPIVLCKAKDHTSVHMDQISPGLDKIGVMLPYAPLLELITHTVQKPLVATSANISGSPIIFRDNEALAHLVDVADGIVCHNREIVVPQDDSVLQFTPHGERIIIRRSRGLAPNYYPAPFRTAEKPLLAMGAELKNAFAIYLKKNLYVSQYLGNQSSLESQAAMKHTLDHLSHLLRFTPAKVLVDKHPGYNITAAGKQLAQQHGAQLVEIQHHEAHFAAVLAENGLARTSKPVAGFIWDGTGHGNDGQTWGGEVFVYHNHSMQRKLHLRYMPQLLGDKMSKEPRLSAFSLLHGLPDKLTILRHHFADTEWAYYKKLLGQEQMQRTSSMGRLLDAIACILGVGAFNSYEGEAAMKLEALARNCHHKPSFFYSMPVIGDTIETSFLVEQLIEDLLHGHNKAWIARKVFSSLAVMVDELSSYLQTDELAFSGGVFQNSLLVDEIIKQIGNRKKLYFHKQLSPNDECIGFGQIAHYNMVRATENETTVSHVLSHSR